MIDEYLQWIPEGMAPEGLEAEVQKAGGGVAWASKLYAKSVFDDADAMAKLLSGGSAKAWAKLSKDPAYGLIERLRDHYFQTIAPEYGRLRSDIERASGAYTKALRQAFPKKVFPVDANSTLRLTYGKVEGSAPYDGMQYNPLSTARGILQKYVPGDPDFDMPTRLVELLEDEHTGTMRTRRGVAVCFTGSNHTTGGNSGSPALDAEGTGGHQLRPKLEKHHERHLFDGLRCRNIMVDIRYVPWVMDVRRSRPPVRR